MEIIFLKIEIIKYIQNAKDLKTIYPEIANNNTAKIFVSPFFEILSVVLIPSIPPMLPPITKSSAI